MQKHTALKIHVSEIETALNAPYQRGLCTCVFNIKNILHVAHRAYLSDFQNSKEFWEELIA
jgi:hypothetical protein